MDHGFTLGGCGKPHFICWVYFLRPGFIKRVLTPVPVIMVAYLSQIRATKIFETTLLECRLFSKLDAPCLNSRQGTSIFCCIGYQNPAG